MKIFYYFLTLNLVVSSPDERFDERFQNSLIDYIPRTPEEALGEDFYKEVNKELNFLQVPSKDEINGIEMSENMIQPPASIKPEGTKPKWPAAPIQPGVNPIKPCSHCSSPTPFRSLDTNDGTGDHEEF